MKFFLRLLPGIFAAFIAVDGEAAPVVGNLTAQQRAGTLLVDISYDLDVPDVPTAPVTLEISGDGGSTWSVAATSATGDVGPNVVPGPGKLIVWNAGADWVRSVTSTMRFRVSSDGGFSWIPQGQFVMGRTSGDTDTDAPPVTVTVSGFYLQETEVTKAQWDDVRSWGATHGYTDLPTGTETYPSKGVQHPVHSVSWFDVVKWCNARSQKESLAPVYTLTGGAVMKTGTTVPQANWSANGYRLPTEAEWEKGARGGVSGKRYPWGTDTITHTNANYNSSNTLAYDVSPTRGNHPIYNDGTSPYTSPVGSFAANGYGLKDMTGNVWEWCWDNYSETSYVTGATDPRGPLTGTLRSARGGGWSWLASSARCSARTIQAPSMRISNTGFRLVKSGKSGPVSADVTVDTRVVPTVTSPSATALTANGATIGGEVTADGGAAISERGFVIAVTSGNNDPVIGGPGVTKVVVAGALGSFTAAVSGLDNAIGHTFKAYAMNEKGVAYSLPGSFVPLGKNADLSSLTISDGTLSPGFATNISVYNVTVGSEVASISVTPTVAESGATVKVNGTSLASGNSSSPVTLNVGSNSILVQVTAQNGSDAKAYTVNVVRPGPPKLTGTTLTSLSDAGAVLGATVSESASGTVTSRGFVLATASLPTVGSATSFTASNGGLGSFSVTASGLSSGIRYFARPFAENQDGIGYGNEVSFTTDTPVNLGLGGVGQVANREIQAGEIQRFQLTLDSAKALGLLLSGAGSGLQVRLRNASGAILETSSSGGISRKVLSGSYTVEIENTSGDPKTYTFDLDASATIFVTPAVTLSPSSLISKKLKPVTSTATIRNAGELPDKLRVSATPGNRDFIVSYSNGGNITAAVVAGIHETANLESIDPGSVVRISVTPNRKTLDKKGKIVRKTFTIQMTVSSQVLTNTTASGSVRVSTK